MSSVNNHVVVGLHPHPQGNYTPDYTHELWNVGFQTEQKPNDSVKLYINIDVRTDVREQERSQN